MPILKSNQEYRSPGSIRMVSHDGVVEEEVEAEAEEGEKEEEGEQKPGGEIG